MTDGKYIAVDSSGKKVEEQAIDSSSGMSDASKIVRTDSNGFIDINFFATPDEVIPENKGLIIPLGKQYLVFGKITIEDDIIINGRLVVL